MMEQAHAESLGPYGSVAQPLDAFPATRTAGRVAVHRSAHAHPKADFAHNAVAVLIAGAPDRIELRQRTAGVCTRPCHGM